MPPGFLVTLGNECPLCVAEAPREARFWPRWTEAEDYSLRRQYEVGRRIEDIAASLDKSEEAVRARVRRLRLSRILPER